jgi:hypothetical protein
MRRLTVLSLPTQLVFPGQTLFVASVTKKKKFYNIDARAMMQCSLLIGNTYVFFEFQDLTDIDSKTRLVSTGLGIGQTLRFPQRRVTYYNFNNCQPNEVVISSSQTLQGNKLKCSSLTRLFSRV